MKFEFEDKEYFIKEVDSKILKQAQSVYGKAFTAAIEDGAILKRTLVDHMRRQGLWDDKKEKEYLDLAKEIADLEYKIKSGKFKKASQLRQAAIDLREKRYEMAQLISVKNELDNLTAEGRADNERFRYFVSACVYDYETQKPVFSSKEDYDEKADEPLTIFCSEKLATYMYGYEEDIENTLLENRVLKKLQLLDDDGNLINREGHRVDLEGNLVDNDGFRVDKDGNRVDINNNPFLDDDVIETLEFEDDLVGKPKRKKVTRKKAE